MFELLDKNIYFQRGFVALITLISIFLISIFIKKSLDILFARLKNRYEGSFVTAKTRTVRSIIKNAVDGILLGMGLVFILSNWGINVMPILTGASIIGLAFSFGAQTLVKDLIAGFFILTEDQFNVGDKVRILDIDGTVYKMTLRLTILKDESGNLIYIPNSNITKVVRYSTTA